MRIRATQGFRSESNKQSFVKNVKSMFLNARRATLPIYNRGGPSLTTSRSGFPRTPSALETPPTHPTARPASLPSGRAARRTARTHTTISTRTITLQPCLEGVTAKIRKTDFIEILTTTCLETAPTQTTSLVSMSPPKKQTEKTHRSSHQIYRRNVRGPIPGRPTWAKKQREVRGLCLRTPPTPPSLSAAFEVLHQTR